MDWAKNKNLNYQQCSYVCLWIALWIRPTMSIHVVKFLLAGKNQSKDVRMRMIKSIDTLHYAVLVRKFNLVSELNNSLPCKDKLIGYLT